MHIFSDANSFAALTSYANINPLMDHRVSSPRPLADMPVGSAAVVAEIAGGRELHRKLRALGIRVGVRVRVEHRRGSGRVVSAGSTRIALGGGIAEKLLVIPSSVDPG
jgi:ferrous iron transport protein A